MSRLKLEVRSEARDEGTWLYTISGGLYGNVDGYALQDEIRQKIADGAKQVILDVAAVDKIDSAGVGILVSVMWSASQADGKLTLVALSPKVRDVLSIAMLLDHIETAGSVEEALAKAD